MTAAAGYMRCDRGRRDYPQHPWSKTPCAVRRARRCGRHRGRLHPGRRRVQRLVNARDVGHGGEIVLRRGSGARRHVGRGEGRVLLGSRLVSPGWKRAHARSADSQRGSPRDRDAGNRRTHARRTPRHPELLNLIGGPPEGGPYGIPARRRSALKADPTEYRPGRNTGPAAVRLKRTQRNTGPATVRLEGGPY